jgi:[ribosomal protein S18]-alanine N-acetyltransferase
MNNELPIRLAHAADAPAIARLSRDFIEQGLGWSWTEARVRRGIGDRRNNAIVSPGRTSGDVAGFGIMRYDDDDAHLLLLAVRPEQRHLGRGRAMVEWLERVAQVAGLRSIQLETRASNRSARAFYERLGYRELRVVDGYYQGREASVCMVRELRAGAAA